MVVGCWHEDFLLIDKKLKIRAHSRILLNNYVVSCRLDVPYLGAAVCSWMIAWCFALVRVKIKKKRMLLYIIWCGLNCYKVDVAAQCQVIVIKCRSYKMNILSLWNYSFTSSPWRKNSKPFCPRGAIIISFSELAFTT